MKSVLLIEDDTITRETTAVILRDEGFIVDSAENSSIGFKFIKKNKYDIILCDILLPEMNGFELLEHIKSKKLNPDAVFIYLTAKSERHYQRQGMELGADDFITKPFTSEELIKSIDTQLKKKDERKNRNDIEKEVIRILHEKLNSGALNKPVTGNSIEKREIKYEGKVFMSDGKNSEFVRMRTIIYIESARDYTKVFTSDSRSYFVRKPIKQWHEKLPKEHFLRIHRSTIINTDFIRKVEKWKNYTHRIFMDGVKEPFIISQSYSRILKNQINGI